MSNIKEQFSRFLLGIVIGFIFGVALGNKDNKENKNNSISPVESIEYDTLYITRDSIIERTKYIKVIQHDTIEKVYNLNADSTLDLFYKLVSE